MILGYVRVSGKKQVEDGFGLETQERRIRAYAASQGWNIAEIVRDEGQSGAVSDRPGFIRLSEMVAAGNVERAIVFKLDRLSRSLLDLKQFVDRVLIPTDTALVSVTEQIDTASSSGKLFFNILGSFAEFERDLITERLKSARESKVLQGCKGAGQVFGYRWTGRGRERHLVPVPREIATVRRVFAAYHAKPCLNSLVETARRENLRTRAGKRFSRSTLRYVLSNPFYAGVVKSGSLQVQGTHKPAVSGEQFKAAQRHLSRLPRRNRTRQALSRNVPGKNNAGGARKSLHVPPSAGASKGERPAPPP